jgi:hypothetical protein
VKKFKYKFLCTKFIIIKSEQFIIDRTVEIKNSAGGIFFSSEDVVSLIRGKIGKFPAP